MLRQITARQLQEWRVYADLEPFDEERADIRAASIVQAIFNSPRKKKDRVTLKECMVTFGGSDAAALTQEQQLQQTMRTMDMVMALYGPNAKRARK